jgi:uncharacterized OsmC-like protein
MELAGLEPATSWVRLASDLFDTDRLGLLRSRQFSEVGSDPVSSVSRLVARRCRWNFRCTSFTAARAADDLTGGRSQPTIDTGMGDDLIRGGAACYSSGTAGRAIVQIRRNHLVTDDPSEPSSYYQGPGEAPGSLELFLGGIVSCAVLMLERIARSEGRTLGPIRAEMEATRDPTSTSQPPVLDSARLMFIFQGMSSEEAGHLVETFKGR